MNAQADPQRAGRSSWRHFFESVSIGLGGCLVVLFFLSTFLHVLSMLRFLPWLIAFNAALTGFRLGGSGRRPPRHIGLWSAAAGLLLAMFTVAVYGGAAAYFVGGVDVTTADILIFATAGTACAPLGALLARKYDQST